MKTVDSYNFSGQKALVRVDFNVPLNERYEITDDTRIRAALPTIQKILHDGGAVILMSHFGRPKKGYEDRYSLKHLVSHVAKLLNRPVKFADDCVGPSAQELARQLKPGEVLLLENTRFHSEEEAGDTQFARELASLGDVYVNDAFGSAHRAHASTAVVAGFFPPEKRLFGKLMAAEVENAQKVLKNAQKPFTAIIGGAKVSDKILIIENLLTKADTIMIGGGMAYTFFKAMGGNVGKSLVENDRLETARALMQKATQLQTTILLPEDSRIADRFANDAHTQIAPSRSIPDGWMGLDIGEKAIQDFSEVIQKSKTILWNGPMGVFEFENFSAGTRAVAKAIAAATRQGAFSLVGGGDSVAALNQVGLAAEVSYVSTGGGAMLEFFEGKELPGIKAIQG
ncbi:MAG: phosphoglycerate kinase [Chitinophagales bacterium]|nr:MAG: phosphoglycerate kinase [Chitinophagales bacterium]